jgi:hypothetical protein
VWVWNGPGWLPVTTSNEVFWEWLKQKRRNPRSAKALKIVRRAKVAAAIQAVVVPVAKVVADPAAEIVDVGDRAATVAARVVIAAAGLAAVPTVAMMVRRRWIWKS